MARAVLEVAGDIRRLQAELSKVPGVTDKAAFQAALKIQDRFDKAQTAIARTAERSAKAAGSSWTAALSTAAGNLAARAAAMVVQSLKEVALDAHRTRTQILSLEQSTGIAAETLSGMEVALKGTGTTLETLERGFRAFGSRIHANAKQLGELGVATTDAAGNMRPLNDVFVDTVEALQDTEDVTTRTALATELLGSKAGDLMAALGDTRLSRFNELAKEFGVQLGPNAARAAADWNTAVGNLQLSTRYAVDNITQAFGMEDAAAFVNNFSLGFVASTKFVKIWATNILNDLKYLADSWVTASDNFFANVGDNARAFAAARELISAPFQVEEARNEALKAAEGFYELATARREAAARPELAVPGQKPFAAVVAEQAEEATRRVIATTDAQSEAFENIFARMQEAARDPLEAINHKYDVLQAQIEEYLIRTGDVERASYAYHQAEIERTEELEEAKRRLANSAKDAADEQNKAAERASDDQRRIADETSSRYVEMFETARESAFGLAKAVVEQTATSARKQHKILKALALAEINMNTARASMQAFATAKNWIEGIVAAAAITATGIAQAALVASNTISFHSGGMVTNATPGAQGAGLMADEVPAKLKRGEVVVDAPTVERAGGTAGIRRALDDGGGPSHMVAQFVLDGEVIELLADSVARRVGDRSRKPRTRAA